MTGIVSSDASENRPSYNVLIVLNIQLVACDQRRFRRFLYWSFGPKPSSGHTTTENKLSIVILKCDEFFFYSISNPLHNLAIIPDVGGMGYMYFAWIFLFFFWEGAIPYFSLWSIITWWGKTLGLQFFDQQQQQLQPCPIFFSNLSVNAWNALHPSGWPKSGIMSAPDLFQGKFNSRTRPGWPFAGFVKLHPRYRPCDSLKVWLFRCRITCPKIWP